MSRLEELKERFLQESKTQWEQFQETSLYIQIKEKYENLTPPMQKAALAGIVGFIILVLVSFPWGIYDQSSSYVTEFETKRQLVSDLLKVAREAQENTPTAPSISAEAVQERVREQLQNARLMPEQISGVQAVSEDSQLIPAGSREAMVQVSLSSLNLHQIVDLGYGLQTINPNVKIKDLMITAKPKAAGYFDVIYKLAVLKTPQTSLENDLDTTPPGRKSRN